MLCFSAGRRFRIAGPRSASRLQVDRSLPYPQGVSCVKFFDGLGSAESIESTAVPCTAAHGKVIYPVTTSLDELELRFQKLDPKIKNKTTGSIYVID